VVHALTRAFVAVPCGEPLAGELSRRLDALPGTAPVRWTRPDTWHLTLQFLGDWPADRLDALREGLSAPAGPAPFVLRPSGLGGFPDLRRPRVLFLQFAGADPLLEMALGVRRATAQAWAEGPQDTRPVHPHLTLARVRDPLEEWQVKRLQDIDLDNLPNLPVDHFCLMASTLGPGGARHRELAGFALRKKGE
jgi:2'-5' RNA ligase